MSYRGTPIILVVDGEESNDGCIAKGIKALFVLGGVAVVAVIAIVFAIFLLTPTQASTAPQSPTVVAKATAVSSKPVKPTAVPVTAKGDWQLPVKCPIYIGQIDKDHGKENAWDFCVPKGTPVYPVNDGVVLMKGNAENKSDQIYGSGYGYYIIIKHPQYGVQTNYAHFTSMALPQVGEKVTKNTVLGYVGMTGWTSFGPHVHLAFRRSSDGKSMPTMDYLGEYWPELKSKYKLYANVPAGTPI